MKKSILLILTVFLASLILAIAWVYKTAPRSSDYLSQNIFTTMKSSSGDFRLNSNPVAIKSAGKTIVGVTLVKEHVYHERFEFLGCSPLEGLDTKYPYFAWDGNFYSPGPGYHPSLAENEPVGVVFKDTSGFVATGVVSLNNPIEFSFQSEDSSGTGNKWYYFLPDECDFSK